MAGMSCVTAPNEVVITSWAAQSDRDGWRRTQRQSSKRENWSTSRYNNGGPRPDLPVFGNFTSPNSDFDTNLVTSILLQANKS